MDIYERLTQDHEKQRDLADRILQTSGDSEERRRLWEEFKAEATSHAAAEEQTFYATLIEIPEGQEKARHSVHEHEQADDQIKEIDELERDSGGWLQKFKSLHKDLEHHMNEEEQEVFQKARKLLSDSTAEHLATRFEERKRAEKAQ